MEYLEGIVIDVARLPKRDALYQSARPIVHRLALDFALAKLLYVRLEAVLHPAMRTMMRGALECFENAGEANCFPYELFYASGGTGFECGRLYGTMEEHRPPGGYTRRGAMVSYPKLFKNTLFAYGGWMDFDQQKGHPNIIRWLCERAGCSHQAIDYYLENFSEEAKNVIAYLASPDAENPFDESDVKELYNITLYGGGWRTFIELKTVEDKAKPWKKMKTVRSSNVSKFPPMRYQSVYMDFVDEVKAITEKLYEANPELAKRIAEGTKWKMDARAKVAGKPRSEEAERAAKQRKKVGRFMSFFLQQIEGTFTDLAWQFAVEQGVCEVGRFDLAHDGFTCKPLRELEADFVDRMNAYVRAKSGCPYVTFVHKPFKLDPLAVPVLEERRSMSDAQVKEWLEKKVVPGPL
jgi:hypothetical protein